MALKLNLTKEASVTGQWSNPGAPLYDAIMQSPNWRSLLNAAYLIAPDNITKDTSYTASGVRYPVVVIRDGELVLHRRGVRAAYSRARQQGIARGEVLSHLKRLYKILGFYEESNISDVGTNMAHSADKATGRLLKLYQDSRLPFDQFMSLVAIFEDQRNPKTGIILRDGQGNLMRRSSSDVIADIKKILPMFQKSGMPWDEFVSFVSSSARLGSITHSDVETYLAHHGIMGMRWGVRRYRDSEGRVIPGAYKSEAKSARLRREGGNNSPARGNSDQIQRSNKTPEQRQRSTGVKIESKQSPQEQRRQHRDAERGEREARRAREVIERAQAGEAQQLTTRELQQATQRLKLERQASETTGKRLVNRAMKSIENATFNAFESIMTDRIKKGIESLVTFGIKKLTGVELSEAQVDQAKKTTTSVAKALGNVEQRLAIMEEQTGQTTVERFQEARRRQRES